MNRKVLILLLTIVLVGLAFVANKTIASDKISQDNIKKIEQETQVCLDKGIAMHNCNYSAIDKYKIEIEKVIKKSKNKFSQSQYEKLMASQQKWEEFVKANNDLYDDIFDVIPATIVYLFNSSYKKQIYKNRLNELIELYNKYNILLKDYEARKYY